MQEQQAVIAALQAENAKLRADNSVINVILNKIIDILGAQGVDTAELKSNK